MERNWIDRAVGFLSPRRGLARARARVATDVLLRHYEGASVGRRTQGWARALGDANAVVGAALSSLRSTARDLVRNNGHAEAAVETIAEHTVGYGILPKPRKRNAKALELWRAWAESSDCDADGRGDFAEVQRIVMRTVVEAGEVLVRRRLRRPEDGLPLPLQLQVLEPDYLDTSKSQTLPNGGRIVNGIELDVLGRRAAYWLFAEHPGASIMGTRSTASYRVPADGVLHIYRRNRPGQLRGASWFAPVLLKFKDFDEFDDATLMKQKIAACLAVITSDPSGEGSGGVGDPIEDEEQLDQLGPGAVLHIPAGRSVDVVSPPSVREFSDYSSVSLRMIATGLGVAYEDLTGDYSKVNYSSARMARLRHWALVERWRFGMLIPQLCDPVWAWAMELAAIAYPQAPTVDFDAEGNARAIPASWTAPPVPMIEPDKEGLAYTRNIRSGLMSLREALRERGYDPDEVLEEIAESNRELDRLELLLDSDPRNLTQAGQLQGEAAASSTPAPAPADAGAGGGDDDTTDDGAGGGDDSSDDGDTTDDE